MSFHPKKSEFEAEIVVFEETAYWAPELRRQFDHAPIVVRECRSASDLFRAIDHVDRGLIIVDLMSGIDQVLKWFATTVNSTTVRIPIVVCASKETAQLEWILREAGATAFLPEQITGTELARLCRRILGLSQRKLNP